MAYRCAILRTDNSPEAEAHNAQWLGPKTLGIEVTQDVLASRCGLGNIDPQHGAGSASSAIEAALEWPLPPDDARLVTIRFDKDAVSAIAILALRIEGLEDKVDPLLVHWIGALDRMNYQDVCKAHPEMASRFNRIPTDAMNFIIKSKGGQIRWPNLLLKVKAVAQILAGVMPWDEMVRLADLCLEEKRSQVFDFTNDVERFGNIAFIYAPGRYEHARNWGNPRFDVVVVHDDRRQTDSGGLQDRWTLVRKKGLFDRQGFEAAINAAEAKARKVSEDAMADRSLRWGGNANIISSPQGAGYGTKLSKDEIIAIAREHLESGVVS